MSSLFSVTEEIVGFFIIETHVLNTTGNFRSERDVEELWDALLTRLTTVVDAALSEETDADSFLRAKESLMGFVMTLEVILLSLPYHRSLRLAVIRLFNSKIALVYHAAL